MNIVIYGRTARPAIAALLQGAKVAGLRPVLQRPVYDGQQLPADAVFVDGWHGACRAFGELYQAAGVPVYILDLPRLRAASNEWASEKTDYVGIFADTLHHLPARIGNRYPVLGPIDPITPDHLLVCGQKPNDAAHGMNEAQLARWAADTVAVARQYGLPVVYRPHPKAPPREWLDAGADDVQVPTLPMRDALAHAAGVVVHNSTVGVEAIDAGVPVLYTARDAQCCFSDYAEPLGRPLRFLSAAERRVFLGRVGATQWTLAQLEDGTALRCLLQDAPWPLAEEWYPLGQPAEASGAPLASEPPAGAPAPLSSPKTAQEAPSRTVQGHAQTNRPTPKPAPKARGR